MFLKMHTGNFDFVEVTPTRKSPNKFWFFSRLFVTLHAVNIQDANALLRIQVTKEENEPNNWHPKE